MRHVLRDTPGKRSRGRQRRNKTLHEATRALPAPSALDSLCAAFGLSPFERDVLLLCAGMELDSAFAPLCAAAQGDLATRLPDIRSGAGGLAGGALECSDCPLPPLRRWRLIEVGMGDTLTTSPLRIDERVLHYLTGVSYLDARLQGLWNCCHRPLMLPPSHRELAQRMADLWSAIKRGVGLACHPALW